MTNIGAFYLKIFSILEVKLSIYLNRLVFVMSNRTRRKTQPLPHLENINSTLLTQHFVALYIYLLDARLVLIPLRKPAYSNILKILPPKHETFQMKNSDIFRISAQSINCG